MQPEPKSGSPKQRIRRWWLDQLETAVAVEPAELARQGAIELGHDPDFVHGFYESVASGTFYEIGLNVLSGQRRLLRQGDRYVTREALHDEIESTPAPDWSRWLEYDPDSACEIRLTAMTKPQLEAAAGYREERGRRELREGLFLRLLAQPLKRGETVRDHWTDEQMSALRQRLNDGEL